MLAKRVFSGHLFLEENDGALQTKIEQEEGVKILIVRKVPGSLVRRIVVTSMDRLRTERARGRIRSLSVSHKLKRILAKRAARNEVLAQNAAN